MNTINTTICETGYVNYLTNETPQKGSIYASDGTNFIKLTPGDNTLILTADSTQSQGVKWSDETGDTSTQKQVLAIHGCSGHFSGVTSTPMYASFAKNTTFGHIFSTTSTDLGGYDTLSFDFDIEILAIAFKPRGVWPFGSFSEVWPFFTTGEIRWNFVTFPAGTPTIPGSAVLVAGAPHAILLASERGSAGATAYGHKITTFGTPIVITAGNKLGILSTLGPGTSFSSSADRYATFTLWIRGVFG